MDYYLSKFNKEFPNKEVDDYVVFIRYQSFFEKIYGGDEQFILFFDNKIAVGYIKISALGIMERPKLCGKINILKTPKKNEVAITGGEDYDGKYVVIRGYNEKDKEVLLNKLLGENSMI